jgi:hypothetical protein
MSGTTKRLDLQFGSFACSVQGFDDPVQPVQQVLQAMQNLLEETPDLARAGLAFDSDEIERLTGEVARRADLDEGEVEIFPGLIIVRRTGDAAEAVAGDEAAEESDAQAPWDESFADEDDTEDAVPADSGDPGYINIFAAAAAGPSTAVEDAEVPADDYGTGDDAVSSAESADVLEDSFAARLERAALGDSDQPDADPFAAGDDGDDGADETGAASVRDIFAERTGLAGGSIFADPMAEAGSDGGGNLFASDTASGAVDDDAPAQNLFADGSADDGEDDGEDDGGDSGRVESLFGQAEDQPEDEETDEGYTAAGLAKTAEAKTVPELMVTSAAWMVLIQGQTSFTRKDVIKVFETIPGEHAKTLEACIKGFGRAVRNEQLIMIEDGVFGLARTELERFQRLL